MPVNTKTVTDRRTLRFESLDDILADARHLVTVNHHSLGNWSLGQVLDHLARVMEGSLDGFDFKAPKLMKWMARSMRGRLLVRGFPAGLPLKNDVADAFLPQPCSDQQGLDRLDQAVDRLTNQEQLHPSPLLGELTRAQWIQFHCRHAELHLSFVHPD